MSDTVHIMPSQFSLFLFCFLSLFPTKALGLLVFHVVCLADAQCVFPAELLGTVFFVAVASSTAGFYDSWELPVEVVALSICRQFLTFLFVSQRQFEYRELDLLFFICMRALHPLDRKLPDRSCCFLKSCWHLMENICFRDNSADILLYLLYFPCATFSLTASVLPPTPKHSLKCASGVVHTQASLAHWVTRGMLWPKYMDCGRAFHHGREATAELWNLVELWHFSLDPGANLDSNICSSVRVNILLWRMNRQLSNSDVSQASKVRGSPRQHHLKFHRFTPQTHAVGWLRGQTEVSVALISDTVTSCYAATFTSVCMIL